MTRHLPRLALALYVVWACIRLLTAPVAATETRIRLETERRALEHERLEAALTVMLPAARSYRNLGVTLMAQVDSAQRYGAVWAGMEAPPVVAASK